MFLLSRLKALGSDRMASGSGPSRYWSLAGFRERRQLIERESVPSQIAFWWCNMADSPSLCRNNRLISAFFVPPTSPKSDRLNLYSHRGRWLKSREFDIFWSRSRYCSIFINVIQTGKGIWCLYFPPACCDWLRCSQVEEARRGDEEVRQETDQKKPNTEKKGEDRKKWEFDCEHPSLSLSHRSIIIYFSV